MQLIRHGEKGHEKPGILLNDKRFDCSHWFEDYNRAFFLGDGTLKLRKKLEKEGSSLPEVPGESRWASCIARPGMILCIGLNYSDHASESGMSLPSEPVLFMKASNTIAGPYDDVSLPKNSLKMDWEVELGIVLGKDVLYLENEAEAEEAIAGYCVVNDLSERHFQLERQGQWVKGKSCPGFSPVGPFLLLREEAGNVLNLPMALSVNGERMQTGSTNTMVFSPAYIVYYVSQFMKLEAGDLISTGTPPGVGLGMTPPRYLKKGDLMELSIEKLGKQRQRII